MIGHSSSMVAGVQLFPSPLHSQPQAIGSAKSYSYWHPCVAQLDANKVWSLVRDSPDREMKEMMHRFYHHGLLEHLGNRNNPTGWRPGTKLADSGKSVELFSLPTARSHPAFCFLQDPVLQTDQKFSGASWAPKHMPICSLLHFPRS